ncbi:MBL fold metallo-hydrolase [Paenibacillus sp. ALJ109b]|uniref:MBL fold metallo-hydrolase n=1 Tax=Paenibacillus sp. ALJ109b TaxID=2709068 RepID=UPI0013D20ECC|nr:MBL fold metallo-hydrolase [Paenibacillus sp. ALJ109b]NEU62694.1 MBL fold metallo-hydrolase [Paenibacillus sp. ALJ109b]
MKVNFKVEPIGQGLFYNGNINNSIIVYDCGSNNINKLKEMISEFELRCNGNKIDVLMISHFHEDHINGIELLLSKFEVDTVILPYISNVEKALLLAKPNYGKSQYSLEMLIDPVRFFLSEERRVQRVVLIAPGSGTTSIDNEDFQIDNNDNNVFNLVSIKEDSDLIEKLTVDTYYGEQLNRKKLFVLKHDQYMILRNIWKFKFFNLKTESTVLDKFEAEITSILELDNIKELNKQLKDESVREQIAECYASCFNKRGAKFNDTSLVVYHEPIRSDHIKIYSYVEGCATLVNNEDLFGFTWFHNHNLSTSFTGQMLCGDICLNKQDNYDEWKKHYNKELHNISFMLLPHHGSKHNWNNKIVSDCHNLDWYLASAGFSNKYSHPSMQIVNELVSKNKSFINGNELVGMVITFQFE